MASYGVQVFSQAKRSTQVSNLPFRFMLSRDLSNLLGRCAAHTFGFIKKVSRIERAYLVLLDSWNVIRWRLRLKTTRSRIVLPQHVMLHFLSCRKLNQNWTGWSKKESLKRSIIRQTGARPWFQFSRRTGMFAYVLILNDSMKVSNENSNITIFSKLDASSGFYQIPLHPSSCEFITPIVRYCFRRMPFGITSAPEI